MPDYEIIVVGRMGPVVASCLSGLRPVVPTATVLRAVVLNHGVVVELLGMLAEHHLTPVDIRIDPVRAVQPPAANSSARTVSRRGS